MKWISEKSCNYCGTELNEILDTEHSLFGHRIRFSVCRCGLYQMNPHPDPEDYYDLFMSGTVGGKAYQMLQTESFSVPEEIFVPGGTLWDMGCGLGKLLTLAEEHGMVAGGNDINLANVKYARRQGGTVSLRPTYQLHLGILDVITMKSYLAHTFYPFKELCRAYDGLKWGGTLFFRGSVLKNIGSHELEVDHMSYYTWNCLLDMIRDAGFTVESLTERKPQRRDLYEAKLDIIARKV